MASTGSLVDLSQFESLDDALAKIEPNGRYLAVAKSLGLIEGRLQMNLLTMFWLSMLTRSEGLHAAIAREARESNPYAVFPLIRAFTETLVMVIYVLDHPQYVEAITISPAESRASGPKRRSIHALVDYAKRVAPGLGNVYAELSEATHVGSIAVWTAHRIEDEAQRRTSWSSRPTWRSEREALIACAQTLELADEMALYLREFAERYVVLPVAPDS